MPEVHLCCQPNPTCVFIFNDDDYSKLHKRLLCFPRYAIPKPSVTSRARRPQQTHLYRTNYKTPLLRTNQPRQTQNPTQIPSNCPDIIRHFHLSVCGSPGIKRINNKRNPLPSERNALNVVVTRAGPVSHITRPGPGRTSCHGMAWHARYQIPTTRAALVRPRLFFGALFGLAKPRVEQEHNRQTARLPTNS